MTKNVSGGNHTHWRLRRKVRERDRTCRVCGARTHLQAHHIIHLCEDISLRNEPDNLILLCSHCHKAIHKLDKKRMNELDTEMFLEVFERIAILSQDPLGWDDAGNILPHFRRLNTLHQYLITAIRERGGVTRNFCKLEDFL